MKSIKNLIMIGLALVLMAGMLGIQSCQEELFGEPPYDLEKVSRDDVDITSEFTGMTIGITKTPATGIITGATYTTTGDVAPIWPASGSWSYSGTYIAGSKIAATRNDGLPMEVTISEAGDVEGNKQKLSFSFNWDTTIKLSGGGRSASIGGKYEFIFNRAKVKPN